MNEDETRVVWLDACAHVAEALEVIHECAHAHAEVTSLVTELELAYIVDMHHGGKLTFSLEALLDWELIGQQLRRSRNDDATAIWLEPP